MIAEEAGLDHALQVRVVNKDLGTDFAMQPGDGMGIPLDDLKQPGENRLLDSAAGS